MRSPVSKAELVNRLFSFDFSGDWRNLGPSVNIERVKPNAVKLTFPDTDRAFVLSVSMPREDNAKRYKRTLAAQNAAQRAPGEMPKRGRPRKPEPE